MRELLSVGQPCILCHEAMMVSVLYRDDETGEEQWTHEPIPHECWPMRALKAERTKATDAKSGAAVPSQPRK